MGDRIGLWKLLWQELRMCVRVRVPRSLIIATDGEVTLHIMNSFFSSKADGDCESVEIEKKMSTMIKG